jgi:hypothetical protein
MFYVTKHIDTKIVRSEKRGLVSNIVLYKLNKVGVKYIIRTNKKYN